jgi:hypothetical protein
MSLIADHSRLDFQAVEVYTSYIKIGRMGLKYFETKSLPFLIT